MNEFTKKELANFMEKVTKMEENENFRIEIIHEENREILNVILYGKEEVKNFVKEKEADKTELLERRVTEILNHIGLKTNVKGFNYNREAIIQCVNNPELINSITKRLYPNIAQKYETVPSRVERAIRHAIETAFLSGNLEYINKIFGHSISDKKVKPTNSEFISKIVDMIRHNMI